MKWDQIVNKFSPYIVKIETQTGHGTGFLSLYNETKTWCGVATALHVVDHADKWKQPIKIIHQDSNESIFLEDDKRIIYTDYKTDSAVVLFFKDNLPFPEDLISLLPSQTPLGIGVEVGWLGFPAVAPFDLCFFSGNISARQEFRKAYLIDGVAINGVSGGPVLFSTETEGVQIVGTVSAYQANRATGEALPGLLIAQDVSHFHDVADHIRSLDDANKKKKELEEASKQQEISEQSN